MSSKTAKSSSGLHAKSVVFIVYPEVKLLDLAGPLQVFADAVDDDGNKAYHTSVVSVCGGAIRTDTAMAVTTEKFVKWNRRKIDTLFLVGGKGVFAAMQDDSFLKAIKRQAGKSRRVASICTGAFLLAECGLLDGYQAVTHWSHCDRLAEYPLVNVDANKIYVNDRNLWTSAGVTAGIDMAIAMIAQDLGRTASLALAKSLVTYLVRPGGQSQFSQTLTMQFDDTTGRFDELHLWIEKNLRKELKVEQLANHVAMSPRNFTRSYLQATGMTPAKAVEKIRVDAACALLGNSGLTVATIATRCGFGDYERMRRSFDRRLKISPQQYRERFS